MTEGKELLLLIVTVAGMWFAIWAWESISVASDRITALETAIFTEDGL